jgi:hypothetical protein
LHQRRQRAVHIWAPAPRIILAFGTRRKAIKALKALKVLRDRLSRERLARQ